MTKYSNFSQMYKLLKNNKDIYLVLENRPAKYMFGALNYGEIPGYFNKADKDPWDVVVPGYLGRLPTNTKYKITGLRGVYMLPNGNHKLMVDINGNKRDLNEIKKEMFFYKRKYENFTKLRGSLIFFDP